MEEKKIGFIASSNYPKLLKSDELLKHALEKEGFQVTSVSWDDRTVHWEAFDCIVLRAAWNYHLNPQQFLTWLDSIERLRVKILNPPDMIRWNMKKTYMLELQGKGIPIVPTKIVKETSDVFVTSFFTSESDELIFKPLIGANAYNVFKIKRTDMERRQKEISGLLKQTSVLVQPFLPEIQKGELSLMFFGETFSHAIIKIPRRNEFRSNRERGAREQRIDVSPGTISQALNVIHVIPQGIPLYTRVDGIIKDDQFVLMELELIEPYLFMEFFPQGVDLFVEEFKKLMQ